MNKPEKMSYDEFMSTVTMFWIDRDFEKRMKDEADSIANNLEINLKKIETKEGLKAYIKSDKDSLTNVLSLLGVSEEKFKRIISLIRREKNYTFSSEWSIEKTRTTLCEQESFMEDVCELLINGVNSDRFKRKIPDFYREQFHIEHATLDRLTSREDLLRMAKKQLDTKYNTGVSIIIGKKIEDSIKLTCDLEGLTFEKNVVVPMFNRQFSFVIPSANNPKVLVDYSYNITTSSSQTHYKEKIAKTIEEIQSEDKDITLVTVIEGAGWMGRQSDLKEIHRLSHYLLNVNSIGNIDSIIRYSMGD